MAEAVLRTRLRPGDRSSLRSDPDRAPIHGKSGSVGCLAMGDEAAEDLFTLAAAVGIERITVIVAPKDLRRAPPGWVPDGAPPLTADLYATIRAALARFG